MLLNTFQGYSFERKLLMSIGDDAYPVLLHHGRELLELRQALPA